MNVFDKCLFRYLYTLTFTVKVIEFNKSILHESEH